MALELHGNEKTMNLENVLLTTIQSSQYFKNLYSKKTYHEVIDEIYNNVEFLTPYIPNTKTPSTAFCLLYKFFLMKLTEKQMVGLLEHPDSPYIRAIGFLYLRYCTPPQQLWDWFVEFIDDQETIKITPRGPDITMQKFILDLLKEPKFSDTILPRIPVKIQKDIDKSVSEYEAEHGINTTSGSNSKKGSDNNSGGGRNKRSNDRDRYDSKGGDDRDRYDRNDRNDRNDTYHRDNSRDRDRRYDRDDNRDRYSRNDRYSSRDDNRDRYDRNDRYSRDDSRDRDRYRSNDSKDRYYDRDRNDRYSRDDSRDRDRDRYSSSNRDDRYKRDSENDREKSYEDQLREFSSNNKKRSRSRSSSRERYNDNKSTTTTTTSTDSQPKEESESLKKLRSLYGADTDKVSLENESSTHSSGSLINDTDTITIGK